VSRNWSCWPTSAWREADKVQSILVRDKAKHGVRFPQSRFASRTSGTPRMMPNAFSKCRKVAQDRVRDPETRPGKSEGDRTRTVWRAHKPRREPLGHRLRKARFKASRASASGVSTTIFAKAGSGSSGDSAKKNLGAPWPT